MRVSALRFSNAVWKAAFQGCPVQLPRLVFAQSQTSAESCIAAAQLFTLHVIKVLTSCSGFGCCSQERIISCCTNT